jgi:(p)ppGpp synthase/HD superfamily hydrolase
VSGAAPALTERFRAALALAEEVHGRTRRSGTEIPYLAHLLVVTGLVLEDGGDEDEAIAAILHDSVEDGGGRPLLERIRREFGERVAEIVEQLSDSIEPDTNESWIDRKRRYLEDLQECQDEAALRVSLADKVNNARAIVREYRAEGDALWERFAEKTADQQLWYYGRLVEVFEAKRPGPLTEDLHRAFDELRALVADREPEA